MKSEEVRNNQPETPRTRVERILRAPGRRGRCPKRAESLFPSWSVYRFMQLYNAPRRPRVDI